ncbi:MAG: hypothetical protein SFU91_10855 [Chloroherpetonaceae bacterium]|nr:hypothetical protein [Chloroherpetonaceae bacterium]
MIGKRKRNWIEFPFKKELQNAFLLIVITGLHSCHLFQTREPEFPDNFVPAELAWKPSTTSDQVLLNFANAFSSLNAIDYLRSYLPEPTTDNLMQAEFTFSAAPETQGVAPLIFSTWDVFAEKKFFENFRNQVSTRVPPRVIFQVTERTPTALNQIQFVISYTIIILYRNGSAEERFEGNAVLILNQSSQGFWWIREWRDFRNTNSGFALSDLKLRHFN